MCLRSWFQNDESWRGQDSSRLYVSHQLHETHQRFPCWSCKMKTRRGVSTGSIKFGRHKPRFLAGRCQQFHLINIISKQANQNFFGRCYFSVGSTSSAHPVSCLLLLVLREKPKACHCKWGHQNSQLSGITCKKRKKMLENLLSPAREINVLQPVSRSFYDCDTSGSGSVFVEQSRFWQNCISLWL